MRINPVVLGTLFAGGTGAKSVRTCGRSPRIGARSVGTGGSCAPTSMSSGATAATCGATSGTCEPTVTNSGTICGPAVDHAAAAPARQADAAPSSRAITIRWIWFVPS